MANGTLAANASGQLTFDALAKGHPDENTTNWKS
jgi:hypothetical protein